MKTAQSRQKTYADRRRRPLEFQVGDMAFLRVSPWKGVLRFGKKGKLAPRYIGPYSISERVGVVAYRLELPDELRRLHNVFHVSVLRKYIPDPSHVMSSPPVQLAEDLSFEETPGADSGYPGAATQKKGSQARKGAVEEPFLRGGHVGGRGGDAS